MKHLPLRPLYLLTIIVLVFPSAAFAAPNASPDTPVFINEIHYDNTGTDTGEAIEIAGPSGTDLTGWSLVRYNGSNGQVYATPAADPAGSDVLSGTIPDLGTGYGVVVVNFLQDGIQNGAPDGVALVDADNQVIQFLSYEGIIIATNGPANGMTSTDIGVSEGSSTPVGDSLQLAGTGTVYGDFTWTTEVPNTFGAVNIAQVLGMGPTNPAGSGASDPYAVGPGETSLLTVSVTPGQNPSSTGLTATCDLSAIGGSATQSFFDDGTNGDAAGGDGIFSYLATVDPMTSLGSKAFDCTISDAEGRSSTTSIELFIYTPQPINTVFINELHYDNDGTDAGEAIEVAGPAATDLTGWRLVRYNGANGQVYISPAADPAGSDVLNGTIPDLGGGYGVVVVYYLSNGLQNGSPDGVALVDPAGNVMQFLSYEGTFTAAGGPADGMKSTDIGVEEGSSTAVGDSLQLTGRGTTYDDFAWSPPQTSTFGSFNRGQCLGNVPCGSGSSSPNAVLVGYQTLMTVEVQPATDPTSSGLSVTCDLSPIGGLAVQPFFDDGTNGDVTGGDNTFSYVATVDVSTTAGDKTFSCVISDAEGRTGGARIALSVHVILPIGTVQGSVGNSDDGATFASPYVGKTVFIQGVIYETILTRTSSGASNYAFFVQNTAATADSDPNSSDGIYVYIGYYSTLRIQGGGYYTPKVGDEVVLRGPISEYYNLTEIGNPYLLSVVRSGVDLNAEVPAFEADPPANLADANRYWERREGMRGRVPADSIVLNGRNVFASTADAEVWVARSDSAIAQRSDPYTRRAFRDAHPLDDNYDPSNWDGNGYRILMGSLGIKAAENDNTAMINPARTFDTLQNAVVGGLYYGYGKYTIQPEAQVGFSDGVDPSLNAPPQSFDRTTAYSIVDYNLENLYDYRNNPFSGCDFGSDTGCSHSDTPYIADVTPPFDYVPESDGAYQSRLNDIAQQIINDLHSPDILMVQEVENQDICSVSGSAVTCGTTDNADGKPDVLQDLALKIAANGGPAYDAAFDRDSSDLRGIAPAFLYRTDRVQLLSPAGDPLLDGSPAIPGYTAVPHDSDVSNPKTLNAVYTGPDACETSWVFPRAPSIGLFRIWRDGIGSSVFTDVYVINNHFKSGPDTCVEHRTEQARYNAAVVAFLEAANPKAHIVDGGDLNVYPRPDDPFAPIGQSGSSDQLGALYDPALGLKNLWEVLLSQVPEAAYSYVYVGMAQTLDQMFVNPAMFADLQQYRVAHINSDFPADYSDDVARGTSDHDPQLARYSDMPTVERLIDLLMYYDVNGMITGNNTTKVLLDHLNKAARFKANGQEAAYRAQLQAFANQVQGKAPKFVTQPSADALSAEVALLLSH